MQLKTKIHQEFNSHKVKFSSFLTHKPMQKLIHKVKHLILHKLLKIIDQESMIETKQCIVLIINKLLEVIQNFLRHLLPFSEVRQQVNIYNLLMLNQKLNSDTKKVIANQDKLNQL